MAMSATYSTLQHQTAKNTASGMVMVTLPMAIPDAEILVVQFFAE